MGDENQHARLSPSKSKRYVLCPASVSRCATLPQGPQTDSPAAREGTRAHQLLEVCLTPGNMRRPKDVPDLVDEVGPWQPDAEMVEYIQEVIDYIGRRQIELMPSEVYSEKRVDPEPVTGCAEQAGTVDIQILSKYKKTLEIADLKYGRGIRVDPEGNTQLILYAAGVLAETPVADLDQVETIRCTIMQPRIPTERGTNRWVEYTLEGLLEEAKKIGDAGNLALTGFGPAVPGEEQCRWCDFKSQCEERREWAMQSSGVVFGDVSEKSAEDLREELLDAVDTIPGALTDEKLSSILDGIPAIEAYCRDMKVEARRRLERGRTVPGYKLVEGKRARKWLQEDDDVKSALKGLRIKVSDFTATKLLGVAKIRGLLPAAKRDKFDELWFWMNGSPTVAHDSDERPAVNVDAVTFGPVGTD